MRQALAAVALELDALLEVDQVELHLVRAAMQREVGDHHVEQRRFPGARFAGDQRVLAGALAERQHLEFLRPAAADQREVALHPPRVVVGTGVGHHRHHVDVRANHLLLDRLARHLPRKARAPRQAGADHVVGVFVAELHRHPVADRGQVGIVRRLVPDLAAEHAVDLLDLAVAVVAQESAEIDRRLTDQARRHPALRLVRHEGLREKFIPSQLGQSHPGAR